MKTTWFALIAPMVVALGAGIAQAGPFERRLESSLTPAVDEAMRKVFPIDALERLNRKPTKKNRPSTPSVAPSQTAPKPPEAKPPQPPSEPARRGVFRHRPFHK